MLVFGLFELPKYVFYNWSTLALRMRRLSLVAGSAGFLAGRVARTPARAFGGTTMGSGFPISAMPFRSAKVPLP